MSYLSSVQLSIALAWKAKFWLICIWMVFFLGLVVILAAQFSGRQPATVGLDVGISFVRIYMTFLIAMLTQELLSKEFERRYFLYSLSYPISRGFMLFTRMLSVYLISVSLLLVSMVILAIVVGLIAQGYEQARPISLSLPFAITVSFLALDLAIISAFSVLLAVVSKTPGFVLIGTIGFAVLARSYSSVIGLLGGDRIVVENQETYQSTLSILGFILPDLGALDVRHVSLYGDLSMMPPSIFSVLASSAIYLVVTIMLAIFIFKKRRLG